VTGKTNIGFKWTIIRVIANPLFIVIGYQFGLIGIVSAQAAYSLLFYTVYWKIVINKVMSILTYKEYLQSILRFFLSSLILFLAFSIFKAYLGEYNNYIWINLILFGSLFMGSYLIMNANLYKRFVIAYLQRKVI
jgi:hypothetical protein